MIEILHDLLYYYPKEVWQHRTYSVMLGLYHEQWEDFLELFGSLRVQVSRQEVYTPKHQFQFLIQKL